MIRVTKCPPRTKIRQVHGLVNVQEWGNVQLQVDGEEGKLVIRLEQILIIPNISVNLFSLQRVITKGYLPVYGEVANKCLIKRKTDTGDMVQFATLSIENGRPTLD